MALRASGAAFALVVVAHLVARLVDTDHRWLVNVPPIVGDWDPRAGWAAVPAVACLLVGAWLHRRVDRWPLRRSLAAGYGLALAWTTSLALVRGPWTPLLERRGEYLSDLPRIPSALGFLRGYADGIATGPDAWTTHVAAHPPLATLTFWSLDRLGLPGGLWAGLLCIVVGCAAGTAWVAVAARLGSPLLARRAVVPLALTPAALWIGVSGDALFAGVAALGTALALRGALTRSVPAALAGGALLGTVPYLSYGLALFVVPLAAVVALSGRQSGWEAVRRGWLAAASGALSVAVLVTVAGFRWWEGLSLLHGRYYDGVASSRPQWYFVWANPAALVVCLSPVVALAGWVVARVVRDGGVRTAPAVVAIPLAAAFAMALADLTALSKAETERIWLPFALAVPLALALLPARWRAGCVVAGGAWALAVTHLVRTGW